MESTGKVRAKVNYFTTENAENAEETERRIKLDAPFRFLCVLCGKGLSAQRSEAYLSITTR